MSFISRVRGAWDVLRGYAAASVDARSFGGWNPSGGTANAEVGSAAVTIYRRARDAVRNDPYAARIVDVWTGNAVGAGITTRWPDAPHSGAWKRWTSSTECDAENTLDYPAIQALCMRSMVETGGVFVKFLTTPPTRANPVGLQLQVLEEDHLDTSKNGYIDGRPTIQGIALGDRGQPVGYWLFKWHPGSAFLFPSGPNPALVSEYVPASDVIHIYRKRRPGQLRDVSWLAPVLMKLHDLASYEEALIMKAKIEACLAAVVTEDGDETLTGDATSLVTDANGNPAEQLEPGMILYRRGAGSVEVVNPSGGGSHVSFARRALEAISAGAGLPYANVSGDLSMANYASQRAGDVQFRRLNEQVQFGLLVPMMVLPIVARFHAQGAILGLWDADFPDDVAHVPPAHEMTDPLKDTAALVAQVRAALISPQEATASFGNDFAEIVKLFKKANKLIDDAGLTLDTDPRRVAKSGVAHDPAQVAAVEISATGAAQPLRQDQPAAQPPASGGQQGGTQ